MLSNSHIEIGPASQLYHCLVLSTIINKPNQKSLPVFGEKLPNWALRVNQPAYIIDVFIYATHFSHLASKSVLSCD